MTEWIDVAPTEQIPPGGRHQVETDLGEIAVFNIDGNYYAIENVCTHDGGELTGGTLEGDQVICPRHGARFSLRTGEALTPPAYEPVATFPVRILDGMVQIRVG